jgi:hypothetical protein
LPGNPHNYAAEVEGMRMRRVVALTAAMASVLYVVEYALMRPTDAAAAGWWDATKRGAVYSLNLRSNGNGTVYLLNASVPARWETVAPNRILVHYGAGRVLAARLQRDPGQFFGDTLILVGGKERGVFRSIRRRRPCFLSPL